MTQTAIMRFTGPQGLATQDTIELLCHQRLRWCLQWHIAMEWTLTQRLDANVRQAVFIPHKASELQTKASSAAVRGTFSQILSVDFFKSSGWYVDPFYWEIHLVTGYMHWTPGCKLTMVVFLKYLLGRRPRTILVSRLVDTCLLSLQPAVLALWGNWSA